MTADSCRSWGVAGRRSDREADSVSRHCKPIISTRRSSSSSFEWLEETDDRAEPEVFGAIAGALAGIPWVASESVGRDIQHAFPVTEDSPAPRVLGERSFPEYRDEIRPRILAILEREADPKTVPQLLRAWDMIVA